MKKLETRSAERIANFELELETRRVIADHLPTLYAVFGKHPAKNGEPINPEIAEMWLRSFFQLVDETIERAGKKVDSNRPTINQFKIFYRRLYTVAPIKAQIAALEDGKTAAIKMAGSEDRVRFYMVDSSSGRFFAKNAALIMSDPAVFTYGPVKETGALLIVDDAAHSGIQLACVISDALQKYPGVPVVASVGVITRRAESALHNRYPSQAKIIYQQRALDLSEMIGQVKSLVRQADLRILAEEFFRSQGCSVVVGMRLTHIITPFKMPDGISNGGLNIIRHHNKTLRFDLENYDLNDRDGCYPDSL